MPIICSLSLKASTGNRPERSCLVASHRRGSSAYRLWSLTGAARFLRMRIFSISTVTEKAMEK